MISSATSTKSKLSLLETVYPPISNQEAVWLQNDPEVEALLRQSDFYMIGFKKLRAGIIRYTRGHIHIIDRSQLENTACECYARSREYVENVFNGNAKRHA